MVSHLVINFIPNLEINNFQACCAQKPSMNTSIEKSELKKAQLKKSYTTVSTILGPNHIDVAIGYDSLGGV